MTSSDDRKRRSLLITNKVQKYKRVTQFKVKGRKKAKERLKEHA